MCTVQKKHAWEFENTAVFHPRDHTDLTFLVVKVTGAEKSQNTAVYGTAFKDFLSKTLAPTEEVELNTEVYGRQSVWVSHSTHPHLCVFVGSELESPHQGSVPWSSPRGASTCPSPKNVPATLDQWATPPAFVLWNSSSDLLHLRSCSFCSLFLLSCSTPFCSDLSLSLPLTISLRPSLPPGAGLPSLPLSLTLPPWLTAQVSIQWERDACHSREKEEL